MRILRLLVEECDSIIYGHLQHIGDVLSIVLHLQNFMLEALATTAFAGQVDIGHKLHLNLHLTFALAGFATPTIYIKGEENDSVLLITKNECDKEGELFVCKKARVGLQSYGVLEELNVEQIFLFINGTNESQTILGSTITMSPNTILLEFVPDVNSYVSGFGTIDSTVSPEGALK